VKSATPGTARITLAAAICVGLLVGCDDSVTPAIPAATTSSQQSPDGTERPDQRFPDIVEAEVTKDANGTYTFAITVSSPYDTPQRYADGWRIIGPDGLVYGEHTLTHDHASEQPFTRTQSGVAIPDGVMTVMIQGRDKANGYGGATTQVALPASS